MSNKQITDLTAATSFSLTDLLMGYQGGALKKFALSVLIAGMVGTSAGTVARGDDPRFSFTSTPTGTENYEAAYNPFSALYGAVGNGADDYTALAACFAGAVNVQNATIYISRPIQISKTIIIPTAGFKLPYIGSVTTASSTLNMTADPGGTNGDPIMFFGATPTGITRGAQYYRFFPIPSDHTKVNLYDSRVNALAGGVTGKISITSDVNTTGSITSGTNTLTVAAELHDEAGTNVVISGASGANGGFYIIGGIGTGTLTLNTTSSATRTSVQVTYVSWVSDHSFDGGLKVICAPGAFIKKHHTFSTVQGNGLIKGAIGSDIFLHGVGFEGLSSQFVPAGVLASCAGTNQVTITAGGTEWIRQGVAFSLNGGANTYYVQSFNAGTGVITAAVTNPATTFPTATGIQIGQGISSGIVGVSATGTSGTNTAVLNSTDGIFLNLPIYFFGDTAGPHTVTAIDQSTRTVTFTNNLTTNLSSACVMSIGGDDGLDLSSVRHAVVSFCNFRHFGDAALRMQSNVAFYGSRSTSDVNGGANTSQIYVTYCNFYNIYQTSTTTNNFTMGGGRDMYMMYNTFESLRGSVKFAGRVPGSRNINIIGNVITSSDNHGFECDSQSDLRIMGNQVYNVFNQGVFCTVNNGPTNVTGTVNATTAGSPIVTMSTTSFCKVAGQISIAGANGPFTILSVDSGTQITLATNCDVTISTPSAYGIVGLGVTGFAISGLKIKDNVFDNCGQIGTASAIRLQSDGYLDGYRFDYKDVTITGNTIRNVTNTANIGINLSLGSYVGLEIDKNKFLDYQGVAAIKYLGRGSTTVGFINGIRIRDNEIQLNNASANGIWVETNGSTTQQLNDVSLINNCITGTYSKQYVVGNLNNTRITNRTNSTLIPQGQVFFNSAPMKNFTIDGKYQLTKTTSGTTPASLLFDNTTATAKILLNPNQAMGFNAKITGRDTSGNCGSYTLTGLIKQGANAAATALVGSPTFTALFEDTAGWSVAATADTTNGALDLTATGTTGAVIHWVAVVDTVEIT